LKRTIPDLAGDQQEIELAQRVARVVTFEIVFWAEQALPAGLALSLGDGARRAMVERKRFSAFTWWLRGRNSGGCAWLVRLVRPNP
jgi:hypothetical protein